MEPSQHEQVFIKTENASRIMEYAHQTVEKKGWLICLGQPGLGKTSIYEELLRFWKNYPNKFILIETKSFKLVQSRTNVLMKRMIKRINPDQHAPGDIETRYEVLRNCLFEAYKDKKKVILIFDEAQDLNAVTFRELKKLHELAGMGQKHLFSIVMFAKNIGGFENIFANRELGHRIRVENMLKAKPKEILDIASASFGLKFKETKEGNQAKSKFIEAIDGYPVTIEFIAGILHRIPGFDGTVTLEALQKSTFLGLKMQMDYYKISQRDLLEYLRSRKASISLGAINQALNGKKSDERVEQALMDLISKRKEELGEMPVSSRAA